MPRMFIRKVCWVICLLMICMVVPQPALAADIKINMRMANTGGGMTGELIINDRVALRLEVNTADTAPAAVMPGRMAGFILQPDVIDGMFVIKFPPRWFNRMATNQNNGAQ